MNIIIVGGGKKVHFLTKSFISKGYRVTIVNNDKDYCKKLARMHDANIVYGDGTKPYILEDAGIAYSHMVIALTPKDPDNLVICQIAEKIYKIKRTFAVVNDPKNIDIFKKLGIDTVISTSDIISSLIEQKVSIDDITNLIPIEEGKIAIMEMEMNIDYPIIDKKLSEITLPKDAIVGCIIRGNNTVIPRGDTIIQRGDRLIVLSLAAAQPDVLKSIRGRVD
ncbi:MAG: trk/ktr system potassium uptake protein [Candidatus Petromonas sp.]|jgi:trk system potassium uptake protein TrkA|nr:trk/ktr system potassium uptake protein [Candidatus Petromonas sp.]